MLNSGGTLEILQIPLLLCQKAVVRHANSPGCQHHSPTCLDFERRVSCVYAAKLILMSLPLCLCALLGEIGIMDIYSIDGTQAMGGGFCHLI
jgi:hypothetical protein